MYFWQLFANSKVKRKLRSLYVYKNRRGEDSAENVIKAGTSNELLYNDKEVLLKEKFGLLPPDLTKAQKKTIAAISPTGADINNPFTVPEDGWILSFGSDAAGEIYSTIDGIGSHETTPSQKVMRSAEGAGVSLRKFDLHCPYPVKKGQVVGSSEIAPSVGIIFAPCMSV